MRKLQNTLYVTSPDAFLSLDGENILVRTDESVLGRVPVHNLEGVVSFGYRSASPRLMAACAERGVGLAFFTPHGRFLSRVSGAVSGNVLLRATQYRTADSTEKSLPLAKMFLTGKLYNSRWLLERFCRDHAVRIDENAVRQAAVYQKNALKQIECAPDSETLLGIEGSAAKSYFSVFNELILRNKDDFSFDERNRRPPLDPVNALLSFTYSLLGNEIAGALEGVGLDPAVGFFHTLRQGRKSLALDMLEEFRAPLADRFVLSLINLGTVTAKDFESKENGAVYLKDDARRNFLSAWQKRKQEEITHPFLKEKIAWGLVPHAQAMLLSRYLRGDLDAYPPFMWK